MNKLAVRSTIFDFPLPFFCFFTTSASAFLQPARSANKSLGHGARLQQGKIYQDSGACCFPSSSLSIPLVPPSLAFTSIASSQFRNARGQSLSRHVHTQSC
ncbi:hypothetical protein J3F83DRAFT_747066, partial [Trichoderma novae-zelandiae]